MSTVIITGGSGLIGNRLSELLTHKGYTVRHLTRTVKENTTYKSYYWNLSEKYIDPNALLNVDHVIHLAGSGVADGRWTKKKKASILSSRVDSANLLFNNLEGKQLKTYISASGISYYGVKTTPTIFSEDVEPAKDFLANVTVQWEKSAQQFSDIAQRVVCLRTPFVMSGKGGGLVKMGKPIKMGFGSALGSGKQFMPWVHIDDLCNMYIQALEDSAMAGIYNASATQHTTNSELTSAIANQLGKKLWAPKVPAFLLKLLLGEMSDIILNGSRISNQKILDSGFKFEFPTLKEALKDCLK